MSGFSFGGFDLSNLSTIGDTIQKFKEDVENTIDASFKDDEEEFGEEGKATDGWFGGLDDIVKTFVGEEEQVQEEEEQKEPSLPQGEVAVVDKDEEQPAEDIINHTEKKLPNEQVDVPGTVKKDDIAVQQKEEASVVPLPVNVEVAAPKPVAAGKGKKKKKKKSATGQLVADASSDTKAKVEDPSPAHVPTSSTINNSTDEIKSNVLNRDEEKGLPSSVIEPLNARIKELEQIVAQREEQLERQALEIVEARETAAALKKQQEEASSLSAKEEISYAAKLQEAEKMVQELQKDSQALQATAKKVNSLEKQLSEKEAEVQQVMQEGEQLSKKQLQMETTIKQLKSDIGSMRTELIETTDALALERQKIDLLTKENNKLQEKLSENTDSHDQVLAQLKSEHEKTVRELRTELIAAERRVESMEKVGSSRKLRDAEAKCEALQESIESLREEMRRQREHADEREDMLSAEVSALSQKCAEAEVRQQDYQNKLPQATAPLLQEIEELRLKLEEQEQRSISTQKSLMAQIKQLEQEKDDLSTRLQQAQDVEEELKIRYDTLYSQLLSTQQSSVESEKIAAQERSARDNAESLLREATSELKALEASVASMEKVFNAQIESMASKESTLQETIRNLEEQASSLKDAQRNYGTDHSPSPPPPSSVLPATDHMVEEQKHQDHMPLLHQESDDTSLLRKVRDLESTRDKLSNALVQAEQQVAKGRAATSRIEALTMELSDLRKKLAAATELLGEREERIEELRADLIDVKEGYKQQLVIMADEITRLTAQQLKKDTLLSTTTL